MWRPRPPRAVKRLINVYRLARTRLSADGVSIEGDPSQPPAYPLMALLVAIETGQSVDVADDFHDAVRGLPGHASLESPGVWTLASQDAAAKALTALYGRAPWVLAAVKAAASLRGGGISAADSLAIARVVRRYSFNSNSR